MPISEDQGLKAILEEVRTIALVGASDKSDRPSYRVMNYLLGQGYDVTPVNPRLAGQSILGQEAVASLEDLPHTVDMVDVFLAPERVDGIMDGVLGCGANTLWLQLGVIAPEAAKKAEKAGLRVVMDHCPAQEIPRLGLEKSA
ncbi:CoA-binding protein [Marinobacteraceae bacterium S3BR75-40.1]